MFLYHWVLKEGLNHGTATKWYSRGANFFPDLTERFRPGNLSTWIDLKLSLGQI